MKIRIKKPIILTYTGKGVLHKENEKVVDIDDKIAVKHNLSEKYAKYPEHIEIVEDVKEPTKKADIDTTKLK